MQSCVTDLEVLVCHSKPDTSFRLYFILADMSGSVLTPSAPAVVPNGMLGLARADSVCEPARNTGSTPPSSLSRADTDER